MDRRMASDSHRGNSTVQNDRRAQFLLDMGIELIITTFFCGCVRNRTEPESCGNGPLDRNDPFRHWPAYSR
jgi:hypothetical protein